MTAPGYPVPSSAVSVGKVHPQLCYKCDRKQEPGAKVFLPWRWDKGQKQSPPVVVCEPCKAKPTREPWYWAPAVVVAEEGL